MLVIDRLEGEYAVCEDSETMEQRKLPKVLLPGGVREGDCIVQAEGVWKVDAAETIRRRKEAQELLNQLYN